MLSRGYQGTMPESTASRLGWEEAVFLSLVPLLIFLRIYLE
jgi:energy-coupling factor transporter transmembrane protein EcfT